MLLISTKKICFRCNRVTFRHCIASKYQIEQTLISKAEEQLIISQAKKGHQPSYKRLYEIHIRELFQFLAQFSEDRIDIQDWCQRAFIKAFTRLDQFQYKSRFKTWLFTIGLNEMRTDKRKEIHFEELADDVLYDNEDETKPDTESWGLTKEALKSLSIDKRLVVLLHIAEEYSHEEISTMLGITESASRVTLHRAKKELRKIIQHG